MLNFVANQVSVYPPLKGEESAAQRCVHRLAFRGKVRINQRLGCGLLQPSRMASCFIQGVGLVFVPARREGTR
jgi:hypothetical protein